MESYQPSRPFFRGVVLAALAPWLCTLTWTVFARRSAVDTFADLLTASGLFFVLSVPVALAAMLVLGLPVVLWLRSCNALNWYTVCAAASAIGALVFALFVWAMTPDHRAPGLDQYLFGAGFGLASGIAFCLGTRPDTGFKPSRKPAAT